METGVKPSGGLLRAVWGVAVHPQAPEIALGLHAYAPGLPLATRLDAESGETIGEFLPSEKEDDFICRLAYSRDGDMLATQACPTPSLEKALFIRLLATGEPGHVMARRATPVTLSTLASPPGVRASR